MADSNPLHQTLLTEDETAAILKLKPETLATWRSTKRYPLSYIKVGRAIRYRAADVDRFLSKRTVGTDDTT